LINRCSFLALTPGLGSCSLSPKSSINKNLWKCRLVSPNYFAYSIQAVFLEIFCLRELRAITDRIYQYKWK
jgi:hypothetical protein